jgi:hypothetical protein
MSSTNTPIANCGLLETGSYQDKNWSGNAQILQFDPEFRRKDFQIYISDLSQRAGDRHATSENSS